MKNKNTNRNFINKSLLWKNMFSFSSLLSQLFTSRKTRRTSLVQSKAFSRKPLSPTKLSMPSAFEQRLSELDQIRKNIEAVQNVGRVNAAIRQTTYTLRYLVVLLMEEVVVYLKAKTTTFVQKGGECMQQISRVISKSKVSMLQTISMIWKSTKLNRSESITFSVTSSYFPSKIIQIYVGTSGIQCSTQDGRFETLSQHEFDLLTRISQELQLDGTHILNYEEILMLSGKVSAT